MLQYQEKGQRAITGFKIIQLNLEYVFHFSEWPNKVRSGRCSFIIWQCDGLKNIWNI